MLKQLLLLLSWSRDVSHFLITQECLCFLVVSCGPIPFWLFNVKLSDRLSSLRNPTSNFCLGVKHSSVSYTLINLNLSIKLRLFIYFDFGQHSCDQEGCRHNAGSFVAPCSSLKTWPQSLFQEQHQQKKRIFWVPFCHQLPVLYWCILGILSVTCLKKRTLIWQTASKQIVNCPD